MWKRIVPNPPSLLPLWIFVLAVMVGCGGGAGIGAQTDGGGPGPDAAPQPDAAACGVGDDEKVLAQKPRVHNGTEDPELCLSPMQQLAVGALTFRDDNWGNACTGTLIADDVVITAAHCVRDWWGNPIAPSDVRFALGRNAAQPDHELRVAEVHAHPSYEGEAAHDVGVLVLEGGTVSEGINVIPIPANFKDLPQSLVGQWVQNGGYGATHNNQNNSRRWWTLEEVTEVQPGEFTVYGQGQSSVCYGDSGGPSIHRFSDGQLAVIGTVSWGDPSCVDYDHFARVDDNESFVTTHTGEVDPCYGIDEAGLCDGDTAVWCEGGQLRQQCCGAEGLACMQNDSQQFRCNDACQGLTWEGRCNGNVAEWCENGEIKSRRCEPCDQICGWAGDLQGYYCIDE